MVFSEDFISELKEKNDIEEIISEYVNIQRKGKNSVGLCPFHAERTPSFCVYPMNGSFYCFGCGAGGDVITFLRLAEHFDYVEAVKYLAERAGMNIQISDEENEIHAKKLLLYKINRDAAKFFYKNLGTPEGKQAVEYLQSRHISAKTIKHFGIGYSPRSGYALADHLRSLGYKENDIVSANLAVKNSYSKIKDRFKGRLMFPIIDVRGNVIAFGARTLSNEIPKYINTADTPIFKKSSNLFALNFAKNSGQDKLILTEGYMDAISLHQSGFNNAVAGLGTALTPGQVKLLGRHANEVILSYDADEAGQKAAKKAMSMLRESGINVKVLSIPQAKDPDEYIRSNGNDGIIKFKSLIENSLSDTEFKLKNLKNSLDIDSPEGKIKYLTSAAKLLALCENPIERDIYSSKLCEETGINKSSILLQIDKHLKSNIKKNQKKEFKNIAKTTSALNDKINKDKHKNLRAACAEEFILSYIINNPDVTNNIFSKINEDMFVTELNRKIFLSVKSLIEQNNVVDINSISKNGFSLEETGRIAKITCSYKPEMGTPQAVEEYVQTLCEEHQKNNITANQNSEIDIKNYIEKLKNTKK